MAIITKPSSKSAIWGCQAADGDSFASGKIISMSVDQEGNEEPLLDSNGETVGLCLYDIKQPINVEVICEASLTLPAVGDSLTVNGVVGIVQNVSTKWEQKGWKKFSAKATFYPNLEADSSGTLNLGSKKPAVAVPAGK